MKGECGSIRVVGFTVTASNLLEELFIMGAGRELHFTWKN